MNRETQSIFLLVALVVLGWLTWLLAPVLIPFAVSFALAYFGDPVVDRLEQGGIGRWKLGRTLAVVVVFVVMIVLFGLFLLFVIPVLVDQVQRFVQRFPAYVEWVSGPGLPWIAARLGLEGSLPEASQWTEWLKTYWKEISGAAFSVAETLGKGGQAVLTLITNLVLIPVVTFYLMRDWDAMIAGVRDLLPRTIERPVSTLVSEIDEVLGAFVRGQLIVMVALGIIYSLGLWLIGIDLAFLIGMSAGLLSIVPYLGSIVGLLAAAIAALFQYQDLLHLVLVMAVFAAGQTAEGMFLTPRLVGDRIGLHPVIVIFAVLAGGQLFGFLGVLLALPAAAALNVVLRHAHEGYRASRLYREDETPDPND